MYDISALGEGLTAQQWMFPAAANTVYSSSASEADSHSDGETEAAAAEGKNQPREAPTEPVQIETHDGEWSLQRAPPVKKGPPKEHPPPTDEAAPTRKAKLQPPPRPPLSHNPPDGAASKAPAKHAQPREPGKCAVHPLCATNN